MVILTISPTFEGVDTDSLFVNVEDFILAHGIPKDKWLSLPLDKQVDIVLRISKCLENHVDSNALTITQLGTYNSTVTDFSINFKQEIVCKTALFVAKKKYGYHLVNKEGKKEDKIDVTGLEMIRSETPTIFKPALTHVLEMILKGSSDEDIKKVVEDYKESQKHANIEDLSVNIGVRNLTKYIVNNTCVKGTPYNVKGAFNYEYLLREFGIYNKYEHIKEGEKLKLIYVKRNRFGVNNIGFYEWPEEFTKEGIQHDYHKQTEKFFVGKVSMLLEPQNRESILTMSKNMDVWF